MFIWSPVEKLSGSHIHFFWRIIQNFWNRVLKIENQNFCENMFRNRFSFMFSNLVWVMVGGNLDGFGLNIPTKHHRCSVIIKYESLYDMNYTAIIWLKVPTRIMKSWLFYLDIKWYWLRHMLPECSMFEAIWALENSKYLFVIFFLFCFVPYKWTGNKILCWTKI